MTYREYLNAYSFDKIWLRLTAVYDEDRRLYPLYHRLYESVKALPLKHTDEVMGVSYDIRGDVCVENCLDSQEMLIDREVDVSSGEDGMPFPGIDVAAHLLWWTSMYGFETTAQKEAGYIYWIDEDDGELRAATVGEILDGVPDFSEKRAEMLDNLVLESLANKRLRYWRGVLDEEMANDYHSNFDILRAKIGYNIGYLKYVGSAACRKIDTGSMKTAYDLLGIATGHCTELNGRYVNIRNAVRFGGVIAPDDDYAPDLQRIRHIKANRLVWMYVGRHVHEWWWHD